MESPRRLAPGSSENASTGKTFLTWQLTRSSAAIYAATQRMGTASRHGAATGRSRPTSQRWFLSLRRHHDPGASRSTLPTVDRFRGYDTHGGTGVVGGTRRGDTMSKELDEARGWAKRLAV